MAAFSIATSQQDQEVTLILSGELDAAAAPQFKTQIESAAQSNPSKLVLDIKDLSYMASAGLRVLVFARQKMGGDVDIIVVAPQDAVRETIEMTGFHHSVTMVDSYEEV